MSRVSQQFWLLTAASLAMMALGAAWALFDARLFQGSLVWIKPMKFALSFVVLFATLAMVVQRLSASVAEGLVLRGTLGVMAAAFWFEMIYIAAKAAQGEGSHYNLGDAFHQAMYSLMGLGAVSLVLGVGVVGWAALRDGAARLHRDLRFGIGVGFILSTLLTLITAGTLSAMSGHFVGQPVPGGAVIPIFGWSGSVGDLRPAHFLALHMMQGVPLVAWLVQGKMRARGWIVVAALAYTALTLAIYAQAMMGLPLVKL